MIFGHNAVVDARRIAVVIVILLMVVSACATETGRKTVLGSVTAVEGDLLTVESFTILADGELLTFEPLVDGEFSIPLPHLRDHLRSGEIVRVTYLAENEVLVAVDVIDANPHG